MSVMLTMAPRVFARCGAAAWLKKNGAFKLVSMSACHWSSRLSASGVGWNSEALLMSASSRPSSATHWRAKFLTLPTSRKSPRISSTESGRRSQSAARNSSASSALRR